MNDRLILHHIKTQCRLGVSEWEQENPQTVWIDLELDIDAKAAAATDAIEKSVDYAQVVLMINEITGAKPYKLIETLAEVIASSILERFSTKTVKARVQKRALPGLDHAAVEIIRSSGHS